MGVDEANPGLWGWFWPPRKATKKKKKKKKGKMGLSCWGWSGHPQNPKPIARSSFFFFLAFQGGQTTPKGLGVASATPIRPVWGGSNHPDFFPRPPLFIFLISKP
jgi:hypothetical protein